MNVKPMRAEIDGLAALYELKLTAPVITSPFSQTPLYAQFIRKYPPMPSSSWSESETIPLPSRRSSRFARHWTPVAPPRVLGKSPKRLTIHVPLFGHTRLDPAR